ncbi:MAG: c-type heme family protein [Desulfuromonadaceae bacterium]
MQKPVWGKYRHLIMPMALTLFIMIFVAAAIYQVLSGFLIKDAEYKIKNVLLSHRGLHSYIQKVMHPEFYAARDDGKVTEDYYSPKIFSSSYLVRNIHSFYNEELKKAGLPEIYYKMASDNPRNPVNRADEFETGLIRMFNEDRDITEFRKIMEVGDRKYLYYAIPFLETNSGCIRCHGKRGDAPRGLQVLYPGEGGFNEKTGVFRAIESIRVPISDEISIATVLACSLSVGLVVMFVLFSFNRRLKITVDEKTSILEAEVMERKKREADLEMKNAELERFAYTVSHDLKSPIITIKGFTGVLEKDLLRGNYERMGGDLKRVSNAADKMNDLLSGLLEISTVGRVVNTSATVDMNLLLDDVLAQLAGPLKNSNIKVNVQPGLPPLFCDRQRMCEVVQNLIENAINYMGDQVDPQILFGVREESGVKVFFVQDNGIGIDGKYHENIFGLFNKLDSKSSGTGIGLALVRRIIEVHGGRVWVESDGIGKGSRFCFTLDP